jgi:hypothetical protein
MFEIEAEQGAFYCQKNIPEREKLFVSNNQEADSRQRAILRLKEFCALEKFPVEDSR